MRFVPFVLGLFASFCLAGDWHTETALAAPAKLNGCAIGDLDSRRPGNEIAAVCGNGDVDLVYSKS